MGVPNYGMLNNMATGLREGLVTYQTISNMKQQQKQNQLAQQLDLAKSGYTQDDSGNLSPTEERQQEIKSKGLLAGVQMRENTPDSDLANTTSQFYKTQGYSVPSGLTFAEQKGLVEPLAAAKAKGLATMPFQREKFENEKENQENSKWADFATKVNDPSSRATIGRYQQNLDKAETLDKLASQVGMPPGQIAPQNETHEQKIARFNKADPRQLYEIAKAADQLTSSANSTVYGTDHLLPKDMDISAAKLKEYMPSWAEGGHPADTNAGEFVERFLDTAHREKGYYKSARDKSVSGLAQGYQQLKNKDPKRFESVISGGDADQSRGLVQAPQQQAPFSAEDEAAIQWAKANPKDQRSSVILKAHGM